MDIWLTRQLREPSVMQMDPSSGCSAILPFCQWGRHSIMGRPKKNTRTLAAIKGARGTIFKPNVCGGEMLPSGGLVCFIATHTSLFISAEPASHSCAIGDIPFGQSRELSLSANGRAGACALFAGAPATPLRFFNGAPPGDNARSSRRTLHCKHFFAAYSIQKIARRSVQVLRNNNNHRGSKVSAALCD